MDRVDDAFARADAAGDIVVRPVVVGDIEYRANAICRGTFAPLRRGAGEQREQHGIVLGAFDEVVRLPPHHLAEADEILQQQRHRIAVGVRQNGIHHVASEAVVGGLVQHRPCIAARRLGVTVVLAVVGRRIVWFEDIFGPRTAVDVGDLHVVTLIVRSLKSLTHVVLSSRTRQPAAT